MLVSFKFRVLGTIASIFSVILAGGCVALRQSVESVVVLCIAILLLATVIPTKVKPETIAADYAFILKVSGWGAIVGGLLNLLAWGTVLILSRNSECWGCIIMGGLAVHQGWRLLHARMPGLVK